MNLGAAVDAAVDAGYDVVCAPCAYHTILLRARKRETDRDFAAIMSGRGASMARQIDIANHPRQVEPVMLAFDDWRAFRAHLKALDDMRNGADRAREPGSTPE